MRGRVIWRYDTQRSYRAINGIPAKGGSLGFEGPTIAGGMVYVVSGYIGMQNGSPGNVLLAFARHWVVLLVFSFRGRARSALAAFGVGSPGGLTTEG